MTMRAPLTDLPLTFAEVGILAGEVPILSRISLTFDAGAPTVLIGPNGSGKTTLLRAAMGLIPATQGRITWGGRDSGGRENADRRAIVFQRPVMLRRSVTGNVHYALKAANTPRAALAERTAHLLSVVGLKHLAQRPARRLSGGEQQRLALARALARAPTILFLDEPTASLDPHATKSIEDVIRDVAQIGVKVVMSTHDLGQAKRLAGDIVLLHRGRLIEHTHASDFFDNPRTPEARRFIAGELLV
jgi:tungstate transport system ATP-binding protein